MARKTNPAEQAQGIFEAGNYGPLLSALGVNLRPDLLRLALTHRSFAYEYGGIPHNERLEFLGDTVLGLAVTEELYVRHPELPEGDLAKIRANVVNMYALAEVARGLGEGGLGAHILLGKGEEHTGGRDKHSILADGMEALLGAIHLQFGINTSREVVLRLFAGLMERAPRLGAALDWKTSLQEVVAQKGFGAAVYAVEGSGPDHARVFTATVAVEGQVYGQGEGSTKKEAEQKAAAAAYGALTGAG